MLTTAALFALAAAPALAHAGMGCGGHEVARRNLGGPTVQYTKRQTVDSEAQILGTSACIVPPHHSCTSQLTPPRPRARMRLLLVSARDGYQIPFPRHLGDRDPPPGRHGRPVPLCLYQRERQRQVARERAVGHRRQRREHRRAVYRGRPELLVDVAGVHDAQGGHGDTGRRDECRARDVGIWI
jgi:hypothetical protein